ncbi:GNAT family N-acetyltransferase [Natroniella sulfidigena]|uniref:GNAT family N-acetyltransferase n=1 Tax=Natroniella sulfidigena TaxID=723921 RepID=UPI00200A7F0C|nr:GNAT family N-acetyltransferase [Natroniella sulfidigena]MCK8817409.1 GNAT family N-acetyltransferase [Natroniella sulfidigena]
MSKLALSYQKTKEEKVRIRTATSQDVKLVFDLTKRIFQDYNVPTNSSVSPALLETKEDVKEDIVTKEVLVATYNNEPVGSVRYYSLAEKKFYLSRLGVLAGYRGQKIGSKLVAAVEQQVRACGGEEIMLHSAYQLKRLLRFYQNLGYQISGLENKSDYTRAIISKRLS